MIDVSFESYQQPLSIKGTNDMGSGDVDGGADCRVLPYVLCRKMKIKIVGVGKHHDVF